MLLVAPGLPRWLRLYTNESDMAPHLESDHCLVKIHFENTMFRRLVPSSRWGGGRGEVRKPTQLVPLRKMKTLVQIAD